MFTEHLYFDQTNRFSDKLKYTTLSYANGPRNYMTSFGKRLDLSKLDMGKSNKIFSIK